MKTISEDLIFSVSKSVFEIDEISELKKWEHNLYRQVLALIYYRYCNEPLKRLGALLDLDPYNLKKRAERRMKEGHRRFYELYKQITDQL